MKKDIVYITFSTDRETCNKLKALANIYGKTQPELIEEICKEHIEMIEKYIEETKKEQNDLPQTTQSHQEENRS